MLQNNANIDHILRRIADTLGIEMTAICFDDDADQIRQEALELLSSFKRVIDAKDRHSCLEFVRHIVGQQ